MPQWLIGWDEAQTDAYHVEAYTSGLRMHLL